MEAMYALLLGTVAVDQLAGSVQFPLAALLHESVV
jgi:hypothetical protein